MLTRTIALAAVLLAGGIATASAQNRMPSTHVPSHDPTPGVSVAPAQQEPTPVVPFNPHVHDPKINPSAAGTLMEWDTDDRRGWRDRMQGHGTGTEDVYRPPYSTMNRDAGR